MFVNFILFLALLSKLHLRGSSMLEAVAIACFHYFILCRYINTPHFICYPTRTSELPSWTFLYILPDTHVQEFLKMCVSCGISGSSSVYTFNFTRQSFFQMAELTYSTSKPAKGFFSQQCFEIFLLLHILTNTLIM
jgi:hypothetical protein